MDMEDRAMINDLKADIDQILVFVSNFPMGQLRGSR